MRSSISQRYQTLVKQDSIADAAGRHQDSLVHQLEGTVKSDQAQVDTAKLNISYCHILAPVTGRVGLRQVDEGNYVQTSDANGIVVHHADAADHGGLHPARKTACRAVMKQLAAGATLQAVAYDRSLTTKLATGTLAAVDNQIDTTTGTLKLRAQFDNKDERAVPEPVRQCPASASRRCMTRPSSPTAAVQRGRARHLRLSRQARQHRVGAADQARAGGGRARRRSPPGSRSATAWWSTAPTSCATAPRSPSARRPAPAPHPIPPAAPRPARRRRPPRHQAGSRTASPASGHARMAPVAGTANDGSPPSSQVSEALR